jgi:hypothetical protein
MYTPNPAPFDVKEIPRFLDLELQRISRSLADNADSVFYRTMPTTSTSLSVSNGSSANWRVAGNVLLVSTSTTQTFTGLQRGILDTFREVVFVNVGSGVAVLKREAAESSVSNRFAIVTDLSLSQNGAVTFWRDPYANRWRGISKL